MVNKKIDLAAKILSIISIGIIITFIIGEGIDFSEISYNGIILFIFFPIGICIGMIYSWFKPRAGSFISIFSLMLFYFLEYYFKSEYPNGIYFLLFTIPAFLFYISSFKKKSLRKN